MSDAAGIVMLIGRILVAVFFVTMAGPGHIKMSDMMKQMAQAANFPAAAISGWHTGVWLIVGSLSIALGIWPDVGALMVAAFAAIAALYFHRYWAMEDPNMKMTQTQLFWRNVIIVGSCIFMFGTFAGLGPELRYSITSALFNF